MVSASTRISSTRHVFLARGTTTFRTAKLKDSQKCIVFVSKQFESDQHLDEYFQRQKIPISPDKTALTKWFREKVNFDL